MDVDVVEVERPRPQALAAVHHRPALAGVIRTVETAFVARRFDHRVEHVRIAARDVEVDLADQRGGQAGRDLLPGLAAVDRLVDAALVGGTAADDVPALAEALVDRRVDDVRVAPVHFDIAAAVFVVDEQRLLPRGAAVDRLEDAALGGGPERGTERGRPHDVRVGRVDAKAADLTALAQARELEALAGIAALEDAASDDDVRADGGRAGADPDAVGIRRRDVDRADRSGGDLAVPDRVPVDAGVIRLPHAAAGGADVEGVRLLAHAGQPGDTAAASGPDVAPPQPLVGAFGYAPAGIGLGVKRRDARGGHEGGQQGRGEHE